MGVKKVLVDRENCIGCTNCTQVCPRIFSMEGGKSMPKNEPNANETGDVQMAIDQCPVQVISWEEENSSESSQAVSNTADRSLKPQKSGGFFSSLAGLFGKKSPEKTQETISVKTQEKKMITLIKTTFVTKDVAIFTFQHSVLSYQSGQFLTLFLENQDGEIFPRSYSVLYGDTKHISFCIHLLPQGKGSAVLKTIPKGTKVEYKGPLGNFLLNSSSDPKNCIATGTGSAPIFSMLKTCPQNISKKFLFGVRSEADIFLQKEFSQLLNDNFTLTLSRPSDTWSGKKGRVTDHLDVLDFSKNAEFYICGSPAMIDSVHQQLLQKGVLEHNIYFERFV